LISKDWLKKWKIYVQYKKIKRQQYGAIEYSAEHLQTNYPGEIANQTLLKTPAKYLRDSDQNDVTNFVVKNKVREGYDYKLMPKECWKVL
jgi:hypothetical protein